MVSGGPRRAGRSRQHPPLGQEITRRFSFAPGSASRPSRTGEPTDRGAYCRSGQRLRSKPRAAGSRTASAKRPSLRNERDPDLAVGPGRNMPNGWSVSTTGRPLLAPTRSSFVAIVSPTDFRTAAPLPHSILSDSGSFGQRSARLLENVWSGMRRRMASTPDPRRAYALGWTIEHRTFGPFENQIGQILFPRPFTPVPFSKVLLKRLETPGPYLAVRSGRVSVTRTRAWDMLLPWHDALFFNGRSSGS